jgi:amino acid transporter
MPPSVAVPNSGKPPLGLVTTTALVIASMIGAGVFTTSGFSLGALGTPERVLAAWLVGSVVALAGAVSYGALAKRLIESGGEYVYLSRFVHPLAGFLAGWISLIAGFTAAMAFAATTLEQYALPLVAAGEALPRGTLAISVIVVTALLHAWRTRPGAAGQAAVVAAKVVGLVLLVVAGSWALGSRGPLEQVLPGEVPPLDWSTFAGSLVWISLSFAGFNAAVYVAEEVDDAPRNVPRAMLIGTVGVALLYLALNALIVYSAPVDVLRNQPDVAAIAAQRLGGAPAEFACRALIAAAMLTSVSALTMSGPRVYAKMAQDGLFPLPAWMEGQTPWGAILLQAALATLVVLNTDLDDQLAYLGFMLSLCSAATVATLLVPGRAGQLTWVERGAALLFVVASLTFAVLAALRTLLAEEEEAGSKALLAVVATLVSGLLFYLIMNWWKGSTRARNR